MSTLLHIIGAGATGKSTLTRGLLGEGAVDGNASISEAVPRAKYGASRDLCRYVVGNLKNGTDSVSEMVTAAAIANWLLGLHRTSLVIVDGVRSSAKWCVDWAHSPECRATHLAYAYLDLSLDETLERLRARRRGNGESDELSEKTVANVRAFQRRAHGVWRKVVQRADHPGKPTALLVLREGTAADWLERAEQFLTHRVA